MTSRSQNSSFEPSLGLFSGGLSRPLQPGTQMYGLLSTFPGVSLIGIKNTGSAEHQVTQASFLVVWPHVAA